MNIRQYLPILKKSALFNDVSEENLLLMLHCLLAKIRTYDKNTYIIHATQSPIDVGIVLSGRVNIISEDYWGNRNILTTLEAGELFGEAFACAQATLDTLNVIAAENSQIMFINYAKITTTCHRGCHFHTKLIQNMLQLVSQKNIMLTTKIGHLTKKTTREKLLSYLSNEAIKKHSSTFTIPFNRQELADFLSVERSAMSAELSRMQKDNLIKYHKNQFTLLKKI